MDTRWRVPDRRYKSGWRWTPAGRRAVRKWIFLVIVWFVVVLGFQSGIADLCYTAFVALYLVHRVRKNRRELLPPQQVPPVKTLPGFAPTGEVRTRQALAGTVRQQVWARDGGRCRHCGCSDEESMALRGEHLHFDHVVPFSQNGADTVNNIQLLCGRCNRGKSARFTG